MIEMVSLQKIEARCGDLLNSPYLFKELPEELKNLRALLKSVNTLAREDVPSLIAEVKRLRSEIKRLEASAIAIAASTTNVEVVVDATGGHLTNGHGQG